MKKLFLLLPVLLALAFLPVPSPMAADDHASARDKTFEYGSYKCADDDNPGAFVFVYDGTGLFATEEFIAYFDWKVEGKNLLLTFLSGKQEDKTLKMAILDPSSFKFEKYVYKRYKKGKLDKYKLVADSKEGTILLVSSDQPSRKGVFGFMYVNVRDNRENRFCEMEVACKKEGENFVCKDNFDKRKKSGKMTLKNFGSNEVELESTISGAHNYQAGCSYSGKYRLVK